jgi:hypothetical protein
LVLIACRICRRRRRLCQPLSLCSQPAAALIQFAAKAAFYHGIDGGGGGGDSKQAGGGLRGGARGEQSVIGGGHGKMAGKIFIFTHCSADLAFLFCFCKMFLLANWRTFVDNADRAKLAIDRFPRIPD